MAGETLPERVLIRPWPKMIFLWPTAVFCLIMSLANHLAAGYENVWGGVFIIIFGINLMVLTFDFPRATSLTITLAGLAVVLLLLLLNHNFNVIQPIRDFFTRRQVNASTEFYWTLFWMLVILFAGMLIVTRFDYWELTPNEIIHHHGVLGDTERFSTAGLKINREIVDIFEYALAGAGRMILVIPSVPRPVVLENVLNIKRIEYLADRILDARVVRIEGRTGDVPVAVKDHDE